MSELFQCYIFQYPNCNPNKISVYSVGISCILLFALCVAFLSIPAGILSATFLGMLLLGVLFQHNFKTFHIKRANLSWGIVFSHSFVFFPEIIFAVVYWYTHNYFALAACAIWCIAGVKLLHSIYRHWQNQSVRREKQKGEVKEAESKLPVPQKQFIINTGFKGLKKYNIKCEYSQRTIRNWDQGKCPMPGYRSDFTAVQLAEWVAARALEKEAMINLRKPLHGMF